MKARRSGRRRSRRSSGSTSPSVSVRGVTWTSADAWAGGRACDRGSTTGMGRGLREPARRRGPARTRSRSRAGSRVPSTRSGGSASRLQARPILTSTRGPRRACADPDRSPESFSSSAGVLPGLTEQAVVGRADELAVIGGILGGSAVGAAQTVVIAGDPGVGKTALVARACADRDGSSTVLVGACLPLTSMSIPFLPIRSALRAIAEAGGDLPEVTAKEGEFVLAFDAWLDRRCAERPVVLVIDDLQWADRSTLDAIMYVIAGPSSRRLAVVATSGRARSGWGIRCSAGWRTSGACRARPSSRSGRSTEPGRRRNWNCCSGDPRTSRWWTTCIATRAAIRTSLGSWSRASPPSRAQRPMPSRATSARRYCSPGSARRRRRGGLPRCSRSVAGRRTPDELAEVVGEDPGRVRIRLQAAVASGTLAAVGDGAFWFHHPLNAEVLEAELVEEDRRDLHARFADMIERRSARHAETDAAGAAAAALPSPTTAMPRSRRARPTRRP